MRLRLLLADALRFETEAPTTLFVTWEFALTLLLLSSGERVILSWLSLKGLSLVLFTGV